MNDNNVLITGTPRSGTTLTCHLLNTLPDTVALNEPMRGSQFRAAEDVCNVVARFCAEQRTSILERKRAFSKQAGGFVPDNPFGTRRIGSGRREQLVVHGEIIIDKELAPNFILAVKQPGPFTATLNQLVTCFPVYAIVRNPLATLASWNSVDFVGQQGHFPVVERYDPDLKTKLAANNDQLERQIQLVGWFHGRIRRYLPTAAIIRYEAIVETGGKALAVVQPAAATLAVPLESRNRSDLYDHERMLQIGERLLRTDGGPWALYSKQSVEQLLGELTATTRSQEAQTEPSKRG